MRRSPAAPALCVALAWLLGAQTAVAQKPLLVAEAGSVLTGQPLSDEVIAKAAETAMSAAHPVANMSQGSPRYRRRMVEVLTERALCSLRESLE